MAEPETLPGARIAAALAKFQAALPTVTKSKTATVKPRDEGKQAYTYKYADLADLSATVLPALAAQGIAWTCPTVVDDGRLILRGSLIHSSGEQLDAVWPLPNTADSKALGGAVTYGRRYLLSTLTGVAAEEDNDDAHSAALSYADRQYEPRRRQEPRRQPDPPPAPADPAVAELGAEIGQLIKTRGWDQAAVRERFRAEYGVDSTQGNAEQLRAFLDLLHEDAAVEDSESGGGYA